MEEDLLFCKVSSTYSYSLIIWQETFGSLFIMVLISAKAQIPPYHTCSFQATVFSLLRQFFTSHLCPFSEFFSAKFLGEFLIREACCTEFGVRLIVLRVCLLFQWSSVARRVYKVFEMGSSETGVVCRVNFVDSMHECFQDQCFFENRGFTKNPSSCSDFHYFECSMLFSVLSSHWYCLRCAELSEEKACAVKRENDIISLAICQLLAFLTVIKAI